jgi:hypothetical protein
MTGLEITVVKNTLSRIKVYAMDKAVLFFVRRSWKSTILQCYQIFRTIVEGKIKIKIQTETS